jgi:hypothetical protein
MPTNDLTTVTDDEARMRAFQIVGSDIGAAAVFNGDWHQALRATAAAWSPEPTTPANLTPAA